MEFQNFNLNDRFKNILDTFGGADGGIRFVNLKTYLLELEKSQLRGDEYAKKIVNIMIHFSNLIDIANPVENKK
jgi:hypothetical protein